MKLKLFNCYNLTIKIYNKENKIIKEEKIQNNILLLNIKPGIYKVHITKNNTILDRFTILVSECNQEFTYSLCLNKNNNYNRKFILYDYHYSGLKIERGELILTSIM